MTLEAKLLLNLLPETHFIFPLMHLRFYLPFYFFLSLILNLFYYYFFLCKHQGGCLLLILLEAIIHKRGVHFIWVAFYIQAMIKMHKINFA